MDPNKRLSPLAARSIALAPFLLTAVMVFLLTTDATRGFAMRISRENSLIEMVTAGLLLAGSVYGVMLVLRAKRQGERGYVWGFWLLFSLGIFVVGMEEIAWGQKLFGFHTPEAIEKVNQQHELTLHNMPGLHGHSDIMWSVFALGGLIGIAIGRVRAFEKIAPPVVLAGWFVIVLGIGLVMAYSDMTGAENRLILLAHRMDEFNEMLIAMAACLYLWLVRPRLGHAARAD